MDFGLSKVDGPEYELPNRFHQAIWGIIPARCRFWDILWQDFDCFQS